MPALPLFPLGTVLFPGEQLPLQVFEPRYLALIRDLQQRPEAHRVFGVVAIRSGHEVGPAAARELYGTGTTARIEALALAPGGQPLVEVLTVGVRRFRLDGIDEQAATPYLTGIASWLDDGPAGQADSDLATTLLAEVTAYRGALGVPPGELPGAGPDVEAGAVAFAAVAGVALAPAERQRVLDAPDVSSRLRVALDIVRRERALVERLGSVPQPADLGAFGLN
ncbi:MAG: LON peptidase substrate-binding domain-containing protein [Dermatophilaceae bacterium]